MAVFGKNIIENITTSMYTGSKVIYREYVQNSCDGIDAAIRAGIVSAKNSTIDISIDAEKREIRIRDNGTGVKSEDFVRVLSDIANSDKKRSLDKGFRGIGRLCGLAYCKQLCFISSAIGEASMSIMTWDAYKMRTMLNDDRKHTADEVLAQIMSVERQEASEAEHFFEVIMTDVTSDDLLKVQEIRAYLEFEIPVPYPNKFMFNRHIYAHAESLGYIIDEYNAFVNNEQLFKGYTSRIYSGGRVHDDIREVRFQDFYDENEKLIAWMWYGLSSLNGQIKLQGNPQRGIRLRKNNIQIGEQGTLRRLFKDARGNEYYIGEVFAVHPDLIPNARRDYFNENIVREKFEKQLREFFDYLWKLCNVASEERSAYRAIKEYSESLTKYEEKMRIGFSGGVDREAMQKSLEDKKQRAEKAQKTLQRSSEADCDDVTKRLKAIVRNSETKQTPLPPLDELPPIPFNTESTDGKKEKPTYITDELSQFTKETRRVVGKIYDLINQNAPDIAQNLIAKIHEGLKAKKD